VSPSGSPHAGRERGEEKAGADGTRHEGCQVAVTQQERALQVVFDRRPKNEAEEQRRGWIVEPLHPVTGDSEDNDDENVEWAVPDTVTAVQDSRGPR